MKLFKTSKVVLAFKNNPEKFLNGLTANTLTSSQNAFVDVHGKIIATFDQLKVSEDEILIVIEDRFLQEALSHIDKFVKLSKAVVEKLDKRVYFDLEGDYPAAEGEFVIPQKKGQLVITPKDLKSDVAQEEFTFFRLKNNIPWPGIDYHNEFLLNVSEEDFVSFAKGCFLGQELLAKVHNRSKPAQKLVVYFEDECNENQKQAMTSKVLDPASGRRMGFVFVSNR